MATRRVWQNTVFCLLLLGLLAHSTQAGAPANGQSGWGVPLGPSADPAGPFAKVRLPRVAFKGDNPHGAALSLRSGKAIVCYLDAMLGIAKKTRLFICDVKKGAMLQEYSLEGVYFPFDFDADGTRIICRRDHNGTGMKDTAELWTLGPEGLTRKRWVPYDSDSLKERDIIWAAFVGAGRIATLSSGGELVLWNATTLKRLHAVQASTAIPAVSPNGNYIAFVRDSSVGLVDADTGANQGFISLGVEVERASLGFRSDGGELVCAASDRIVLIDPTAAKIRSVSIPGVKGQGLRPLPSIGWADDRLLFINDHLVDPEVPVPIWGYAGGIWARPAGGYVWFLAVKGMTEVGLVPVRLPHPVALKKIMSVHGDSSSFLLKPGDAVQVDVQLAPPAQQAAAREALETVLQRTEYKAAAKAVLVLDIVPGKERFENRTYKLYKTSRFGIQLSKDAEQEEKQRFRVQPVEVRLLKDGNVIWNHRAIVTPAPPLSVTMEQNESLTDRLAPFSLDDYGLLTKVELPKFLQEQMGRGVTRMSLGHSVVGPDGIDEAFSRLEETREKLDAMKKNMAKKKKL
jgi:hypothetical protein